MKTETQRFTETKMFRTMTAALASLFLLGCDPMGSKEVDTGPDYITGSTLEERDLHILDNVSLHELGTFYALTYETNLEEVEVMAAPGLYLFEEDQLGTFSDGTYSGSFYDYEQGQDQPYIGDYEISRNYEVAIDGTFVVVVYFDSRYVAMYDEDVGAWSCEDPVTYQQLAMIVLGGGLLTTNFSLTVEITCD